MQLVKTLTQTLRSRIQRAIDTLSNSPMAWGLILLMVALCLLPFFLLDKPATKFEVLAPLFGLAIGSIALAAWLRARAGAMIAWFLVVAGFFLFSFHANGLAWMLQVDGNTLFSVAIGFLVTALAFGQLRSVGQKLAMAYREATISHENLARAHAIIQKQALTDALTGLPNHRAVMDQLDKEMDRARRFGRPFSLLFFDADRFKHVNDTYGHAVGDVVLQQIGERASSGLRGGETLSRFGGEEFVLLLPEADGGEASIVAEGIRLVMASRPMATAEVTEGVPMTVSMGIATYPADGDSQEVLLQQADEAMYLSKRLGRNQVRTAAEGRQASADPELMLLLQEAERGEAMDRQGLSPEQVKQGYVLKMISSLLFLVEQRDPAMGEHSHGVSDLATAIACEMGLEQQEVFLIGIAALLHDIGKVGLPDALLRKAEQLSAKERAMLSEHPELGAQILEANPFLHSLIPAVRHHHERWDGTGYPDQLAEEHIPLAARIIGVAEAYDAMLRGLSYQVSQTSEEAVAELQRGAGAQFDPAIVQALQGVLRSRQEQQETLQAVG